jgi:N-acyl-D-aspartate/D-glutamate deacylase
LSIVNDLPQMFRQVLDLVAAANRLPGINIIVQVFPRPIGMLFGLDLSLNPFSLHPSYRALEHLPLQERVQEMRKPNVRAQILAETADQHLPNPIQRFLVTRALDAYPFGTEPEYEPDAASALRAIATAHGSSVFEVAYDALLESDGHAILFLPINNYPIGGLDSVAELLVHQDTVIGLGDGGAHCGLICDASYPTFVLTYWVRDRRKGSGTALTLPEAVHRLTRRTALAVGLDDRGLIKPGMKADINIIDYDALRLGIPEAVYDLPAAGRRITQKVTGIEATLVSGEITYRHGVNTGALPGRLVKATH